MCITYLAAYADSGDNSNSAIVSMKVKNTTIQSLLNVTIFSDMKCSKGLEHVLLEGKFHNGNTAYNVVFLKMSIFDKTGRVLATGSGYVHDVKSYEIKNFNAISRFNGNFSSCDVQIDNAIPK